MGKVKEEAKEFVMLEKVHEGKTRSIVVNLNLADLKWRPIGAVDWSQQLQHRLTCHSLSNYLSTIGTDAT